jgi:hypothetical protein
MASVEIMSPLLGDALIDLQARRGAGFDECSITDVEVAGDTISFRILSYARERQFLVRFRGVDPARQYRIVWNGNGTDGILGTQLLKEGLLVGPLK